MEYILVGGGLFFGTCFALALFVYICWRLHQFIEKLILRIKARERMRELKKRKPVAAEIDISVSGISIISYPANPELMFEVVEQPRPPELTKMLSPDKLTEAELKREIERAN